MRHAGRHRCSSEFKREKKINRRKRFNKFVMECCRAHCWDFQRRTIWMAANGYVSIKNIEFCCASKMVVPAKPFALAFSKSVAKSITRSNFCFGQNDCCLTISIEWIQSSLLNGHSSLNWMFRVSIVHHSTIYRPEIDFSASRHVAYLMPSQTDFPEYLFLFSGNFPLFTEYMKRSEASQATSSTSKWRNEYENNIIFHSLAFECCLNSRKWPMASSLAAISCDNTWSM